MSSSFLLLPSLGKNSLFHTDSTRANQWKRKTGHELLEKTIGFIGLGRIGKEVAVRARAFGMNVIAHDIYWDDKFAAAHNVKRAANLDEIYAASDYISLHTNLTPETRDMISAKSFPKMKKGVLIINCARGEIVHTADMVEALKSGQVGGYGTDVLDEEPPKADHPLLKLPNAIVPPHIAPPQPPC